MTHETPHKKGFEDVFGEDEMYAELVRRTKRRWFHVRCIWFVTGNPDSRDMHCDHWPYRELRHWWDKALTSGNFRQVDLIDVEYQSLLDIFIGLWTNGANRTLASAWIVGEYADGTFKILKGLGRVHD